MNLLEAEQLAKDLMHEHGLLQTGWAFGWSKATHTFGITYPTVQLIKLSKPLTELNAEEIVRDVILHEIAHALAPLGTRHGREWEMIAKRLGARPEKYYDRAGVVRPALRHEGVCPTCGYKTYRTCVPRGKKYCRRCVFAAGKQFLDEFLFCWRLNPAFAQARNPSYNQSKPSYPLTQPNMAAKKPSFKGDFTLNVEINGKKLEVKGSTFMEIVKNWRAQKAVFKKEK